MLKRKIHVIAEKTKLTDSMTASVQIENEPPFYLHSRYDPLQEAQDWLKSVEISSSTLYIVLGLGLGYHVSALLTAIGPESRVLAIEPVQEKSMIHLIPQVCSETSWMNDSRLVIQFHKVKQDIYVAAADLLVNSNLYKVTVCPHYPSMQIFDEYYRDIMHNINFEINQSFKIKVDFQLKNTSFLYENGWRNINAIAHSPGIIPFREKWKGVPAIIVGSGPSLKKNAQLLNKCKEHAVVIAAGSAVKALQQHGVVPHIFASADPFPENYTNLKEAYSPETMLLATYDTAFKAAAEFPGPKVFVKNVNNKSYLGPIAHLLPETDCLRMSVSVTTMAVDFARYAGCNPIIFVGQDLAFSVESTRYAEGIEQVFQDNPEDMTTVTGADGSLLIAPLDLRHIRNYLENYIRFFSEIRFLNATEGGALIQGAGHCSLQEVIEKYLLGIQFSFDIEKMHGLNPTQKEALQAELGERLQQISKMRAALTNSAQQDICSVIDTFQQFEAYEMIKPVLSPIIMAIRFRATECGKEVSGDARQLLHKCIFWLDALSGLVQCNMKLLEIGAETKGDNDE